MAVSFPKECCGLLVFSFRDVSDRPKLGDETPSNQSRHTVSSGSTHELKVLLRDIQNIIDGGHRTKTYRLPLVR